LLAAVPPASNAIDAVTEVCPSTNTLPSSSAALVARAPSTKSRPVASVIRHRPVSSASSSAWSARTNGSSISMCAAVPRRPITHTPGRGGDAGGAGTDGATFRLSSAAPASSMLGADTVRPSRRRSAGRCRGFVCSHQVSESDTR
jgi:hypothetical protein